ncbi:MAG: flagellar biosynthetic protein FliQ [Waddliaceae bacterium]|nr:flagellar biosynthetic protein FliQ [Waddliaceae bacterium]
MTPDHMVDLVRGALYVALQISAPLLILAMVIGFGISIFQSVTQINEMTLTFVPKILIFAGVLSILFPWIMKTMVRYTTELLVHEWDKLIGLLAQVN